MPDRPKILVIDDIPTILREFRNMLEPAGFAVTTQASPQRAIRLLARRPFDLVITGLAIREMGGFEILRAIKAGGSEVPVIMITGYGNEQSAIEASRLGAADYMDKPVSPDELVARVRRIVGPSRDSDDDRGGTGGADMLITADPAMKALLETVAILAPTQTRVLITGETGTGKQLVARALHAGSTRRREPFVDVNCAAIPESLLESELFGHERGAFTGASRQRIGRFEEAAGGTIFLDEIGEMGYTVQAKLLKVLQDGRFNRVGGSRTLTSRARVIAATNRDLEQEVGQGRFRSDLFYRLQVMTIVIPPLHKRAGDVPLLAEHFLRRFETPGQPPRYFAPETLRLLARYRWPGNVRELANLVERIAVLHRRSPIGSDALPERILQAVAHQLDASTTLSAPPGAPEPTSPTAYNGSFAEARRRFEIGYLRQVISSARGNLAEGARIARMDRSQFFRLVKRHGLIESNKV